MLDKLFGKPSSAQFAKALMKTPHETDVVIDVRVDGDFTELQVTKHSEEKDLS